jgi:hypothetical protein
MLIPNISIIAHKRVIKEFNVKYKEKSIKGVSFSKFRHTKLGYKNSN